jgi:hypothetical protein
MVRRLGAFGFTSGVIVGLALGIDGCLACDESVCDSRLVITIAERDGAPLADGLWDFQLVLDGQTRVAACALEEGSQRIDCEPGDFAIHPLRFDHENNPFTLLQIEIFPDAGGLPDTVEIMIVHNGETIVDRRFDPDYELVEPKRCNPDCVEDLIRVVVERS